jgi:hypothetical protein
MPTKDAYDIVGSLEPGLEGRSRLPRAIRDTPACQRAKDQLVGQPAGSISGRGLVAASPVQPVHGVAGPLGLVWRVRRAGAGPAARRVGNGLRNDFKPGLQRALAAARAGAI